MPAGGGGLAASFGPQVPPPPPRLKVGRLHIRAVHVARATARARRRRRRGDGEAPVDGDAPVDGLTSGETLGDGDTAACATIVPNPPARPIPAATAILHIEPRNHPRLFIA